MAKRGRKNRGRIHQTDQALELAGKTLSPVAADEARRQLAQVFQAGPEQFFRPLGRAHFVRVGKVVAGRGRRAPEAGERPGLQAPPHDSKD